MSFGPDFKEPRTYFPIRKAARLDAMETPSDFAEIFDDAGYECPDWRAGYVYRRGDDKKRPVKALKILSKALQGRPRQLQDMSKRFV